MWIRFLLFLASLATSGCASGVVDPSILRTGAPPPVRARTQAPVDATTALLRAGTPDAISAAQARALLGPPDVERREGVGALLVWTGSSCALALGFAKDRLSTVEPGPRRTGDPAPGLQVCLAEIRARRAAP